MGKKQKQESERSRGGMNSMSEEKQTEVALKIVPKEHEELLTIIKHKKIKPEDLLPKCGGVDKFTGEPGKRGN